MGFESWFWHGFDGFDISFGNGFVIEALALIDGFDSFAISFDSFAISFDNGFGIDEICIGFRFEILPKKRLIWKE